MRTQGAAAEHFSPDILPVRKTVQGFAGTQLLTAFSGNMGGAVSGHGFSYVSTNTQCDWLGGIVSTSVDEYVPEFVSDLLAAAAAAPEAKFSNVVDMLGWLNCE